MKKIVLIGILFLSANVSFNALAQSREEDRKARKEEFFQFRREFMTEQIGLTEQEAEQFFPLYDEMEKKKWEADRGARSLARRMANSETEVMDVEYEAAADALLEKGEKIVQIEREYYDKFKAILPSEKLFKFKYAQERLPRAMMKHRAEKQDGKE